MSLPPPERSAGCPVRLLMVCSRLGRGCGERGGCLARRWRRWSGFPAALPAVHIASQPGAWPPVSVHTAAMSPHFEVSLGTSRGLFHSRLDISGLAAILDHDNHELRKRMKDFMKDECYIP